MDRQWKCVTRNAFDVTLCREMRGDERKDTFLALGFGSVENCNVALNGQTQKRNRLLFRLSVYVTRIANNCEMQTKGSNTDMQSNEGKLQQNQIIFGVPHCFHTLLNKSSSSSSTERNIHSCLPPFACCCSFFMPLERMEWCIDSSSLPCRKLGSACTAVSCRAWVQYGVVMVS